MFDGFEWPPRVGALGIVDDTTAAGLKPHVGAGRARASIRALAAMAPKVALLFEGDLAREVPVEALRVCDLMRVQPGWRAPAAILMAALVAVRPPPALGRRGRCGAAARWR